MPVAFFLGGYEQPWQRGLGALANRGGLAGLARRQGGLSFVLLQELGMAVGLSRGRLLLLAIVLLVHILMRKVLLPAVLNPSAPLAAVLGKGACSMISQGRFSGHSIADGINPNATAWPWQSVSQDSLGSGVQGGLLWHAVVWCLRLLWSSLALLLHRIRSYFMSAACQELASLCDADWWVQPADCTLLFGP